MDFALASQFCVYFQWVNASLAECLNSVLNVKALVVGPSRGYRGLLRDCKTSGTSVPFEALLNNTQQKAGGFPSVVYLIK